MIGPVSDALSRGRWEPCVRVEGGTWICSGAEWSPSTSRPPSVVARAAARDVELENPLGLTKEYRARPTDLAPAGASGGPPSRWDGERLRCERSGRCAQIGAASHGEKRSAIMTRGLAWRWRPAVEIAKKSNLGTNVSRNPEPDDAHSSFHVNRGMARRRKLGGVPSSVERLALHALR